MLSGQGAETWKRAALAKADHWNEARAEYRAWTRTPRGRLTLAWRRVKRTPYDLRWWIAALIYPGDLRDELDCL
jgi:hypothetical protein